MIASIIKAGVQGVLRPSCLPGRELDTHAVFGVHVGKERPRVLM